MSKKKAVEEVPPPVLFEPAMQVRLVAGDGHVAFVDRNVLRPAGALRPFLPAPPAPQLLETTKSSKADKAAAAAAAAAADEEEEPGPPPEPMQGLEVDMAALPYPTMTVSFLSGPQLEAALSFLHYKHKYDAEPLEGRPPFVAPLPQLQMLAVASLLKL